MKLYPPDSDIGKRYFYFQKKTFENKSKFLCFICYPYQKKESKETNAFNTIVETYGKYVKRPKYVKCFRQRAKYVKNIFHIFT